MTKKLTRKGARNVTSELDRIASLVQDHHPLLGIPEKVALDFAKRCDLLSDAVETVAIHNYPRTAAEDEEGASVEPDGEGFDANAIGDSKAGPHQHEPDEPYMEGEFTQTEFHQLGDKQEADELPGVDAKLAAAMASFEESLRVAEKSLEAQSIPGYAGFTEQIRTLEELSTEAQELEAQIEAAIGPLLDRKREMDKEMKKIHKEIKDEYKESLGEIGDVIIERKTKLVEARAMLKVHERKRTINQVQKEMLARVASEYGDEVAGFVKATTSTLRDMNKSLVASFKGFELEQRALDRTASDKEAGLADMLSRFQEFLSKSWKRMVSVAKNAVALVTGQSKKVEKAHNEFVKTLKAIEAGKVAADESDEEAEDHDKKAEDAESDDEATDHDKKADYHGFNLFD